MFLAIYKLCFIFDNFRSAFICIVFFLMKCIFTIYIGPTNLHLNCVILAGPLYPPPPPPPKNSGSLFRIIFKCSKMTGKLRKKYFSLWKIKNAQQFWLKYFLIHYNQEKNKNTIFNYYLHMF